MAPSTQRTERIYSYTAAPGFMIYEICPQVKDAVNSTVGSASTVNVVNPRNPSDTGDPISKFTMRNNLVEA